MSAMTAQTGRRHRLAGNHPKAIRWGVALIGILALSIPVGIAARNGREPMSGSSSGSSSGWSSGSTAGGGTSGRLDSGSGSISPGGSGSGTGAGSSAVAPGAPSAVKGSADAGSAQAQAADTIGGPKIARTAWLGVEVQDLTVASGRVRAITAAAEGQVVSENVVTGSDPTAGGYGPDGSSTGGSVGGSLGGSVGSSGGSTGGAIDGSPQPYDGTKPSGAGAPVLVNEARLTVRVPAERLDDVLLELSRVGTVSYRSSQSEDVTETYVDVKARIEPARDSIASIRALMLKATDLQQIVLLENELTRRQADLDSLVQRLAELERRTTTSDVTVSLWTAAVAPVAAESGFTDTIRAAWDHLLASVGVIVTGLAVLLPWLLIGLLVAWVVTRFRRRGGATPGASAPPGD